MTVTRLVVEAKVAGRRIELTATRVGQLDADLAAAGAPMVQVGSKRRRPERWAWRARLGALAAGTHVSYRFIDPDGGRQTRLHAFTVAEWAANSGMLRLHPPTSERHLVEDSVRWLRADRGPSRLRFALPLPSDAHVIGFGERFDRLDQRGQRIDATVFDSYVDHADRTYLPMPFGIVVPGDGSPGWGFHVRTSRRTWYDVGATEPERLVVEVALDPDEHEPVVELEIYEGPPDRVLRAFLDDVGGAQCPPDWVFRPWMSGNEWNTEARIRAEVERSLAEGIPVGVVVIEAWSDESTFAAFRDAQYEVHADGAPHALIDFAFPAEGAWPDPKGLIDWLHDRGIRVLLWQVPVLPANQPAGTQAAADEQVMLERGFTVRDADRRPYRVKADWFRDGLVLDPTNEHANGWWLAKRRYLVEELGVDGFKTDGGEHAFGDWLRYADGTRGSESNNRYPVLYEAAYHRLLAESGKQPVTFSRSGFVGSQRYPCHWAGDARSSWEAFRASITAGLSASASGVFFWGWDLGGFSGDVPSAELYLRAAAMACFCPIMQYHSEFAEHRVPSRDRTPWNIAERTGDERVLTVFRRYAQLRERLVPYLAEQAALSVENGRPLMRALAFEWPDDSEVWRYPYQYLLGDELLVAPVVQPGATSWPVYLPAGDWTDFWTGRESQGSQVVVCDSPIEGIPVFLRQGDARTPVRAHSLCRSLKPVGG